jgi:hypothetical protein
MKKILLITAVITMFFASSASAGIYDPNGEWTFTTPWQTINVLGSLVTIEESSSIYNITSDGTNIDLQQQEPLPPSQGGPAIMTQPANSGTENSPDDWNPNAYTSWTENIPALGGPTLMFLSVKNWVQTSDETATGTMGINAYTLTGLPLGDFSITCAKNVVPIPAGFVLLLSGLIGVVGLRRKLN